MGEAYVTGHQGDDLKNRTKAAVCLKHYMGYGFPFNGHDRTSAYIPDVQLREYFLPTFAHAVKAGAISVMINSGTVNSIPGHANDYYINHILKGELDMKGFTVSDWNDIERLYTRDKIANSPEEAVRIAVMAGVDVSMVPNDFSFYYYCVNLTQKDPAFAERTTDATRRILRVKEALGLFENPFAIAIPMPQRKLAQELAKLNKPTVTVYIGGRPRVITDIVENSQGLLISFPSGERGAEAIADVLFGETNPSGKLPITYPKYDSGFTTYDYLPLEIYGGNTYDYLFPFGHGLSYTNFTYSSLKLSANQVTMPDSLSVQVDVTNIGDREGKEVVMLFLNDEYGSVPRPVRQLKKFEKIALKAGETKTVNFTLEMYDLSFINLNSQRVCEPGRFNVYIKDLNDSFILRS
jgi:hypothetical protein